MKSAEKTLQKGLHKVNPTFKWIASKADNFVRQWILIIYKRSGKAT